MANGDRTITTTLRLNIGDLKAKAREAAAAYKGIGDGAKKGTEPAGKAVTGLSKSLRDNSADWDQASGAALKAGGLLAAGVGIVVKSYADFDKQMSSVSATGADARQNIDALRETAIRLGADTQFSAGEAAQGIEELLKAGVSAADVMGGGLAGALDLAAAGQIRVADAAEIAATAMVQFKLSGQDVPHIADLLAAAAGKAQGEVGDMAMALKQSGLVASQMGLSIEETTGTLAAFASAGLLGSDAGTAFRTMLLRLANPSKEADALMTDLGISAYDAQGNFVGMESIAGQLETRLGGLTQAQRDSALATLFGSDAIRAANVLYENGASGIAKWKSEVDDAGFAARTAAEKTNNLYGDIERLTGSLDSLFIKSGQGGNDFLRKLAQDAEGLVDAFSKTDAKTLEAGVQLAAFGGIALLTLGSVGKLLVSVSATREAMKTLATDLPRTTTAMKGAGAAAGLLAVAVGGLALANLAYMSGQEEIAQSSAETTQELLKMQQATDGNVNGMLRLRDGLFGSAGPLDNLSDKLRLWRQSSDEASRAWLSVTKNIGLGTEAADLLEQIDQLDNALADLDSATSADAFRKIESQMRSAGATSEELVAMFPQLADKMRRLATESGYTIKNADELAAMMAGKLPDGMKTALGATEAGRKALADMAAAAGGATKSLEQLAKEQEDQRQAALAASYSNIAYEAALDDLAARAKEASEEIRTGAVKRKDALDADTEAGRKNLSALNDLVTKYNDDHKKKIEAGEDAKALTAHTNRTTDAFIKAAKQMGANGYEAAQMAIKLGLIPKKVTTDIVAPGIKVTQRQIDDVNKTLDDVPGEYKADLLSIFLSKGYNAYLEAWKNVRDKTATINTEFTYHYNTPTGKPPAFGKSAFVDRAEGGPVGYFANGGSWSSPGNGSLSLTGGKVQGSSLPDGKDNIPAMLRAREFVQRESATDYYGMGVMHALNQRRIPREAFAPWGFADGGSPTSFQPARSSTTTVAAPAVNLVAIVENPWTGEQVEAKVVSVTDTRIVQRERAQSMGVRQ